MKEVRVESVESVMPLILEALRAGNSVRFAPSGISMLPMLRQGTDSVVLSPVIGRLKKYDIPLYRRDNGKYVLHRIISAKETYTCMGDHQYAPELNVRHDQVIAVVTGFYRGDRFHSTKELRYRFYCKLWCFFRPLRRFVWRSGKWLRRHFAV